jgi:hypothetical protein
LTLYIQGDTMKGELEMLQTHQEAKMPNVQKTRAGTPFSFRAINFVESQVIPDLCETWGEERSRVISRSLQIAWDMKLGLDTQIQNQAPDESKGQPIPYRPSSFEEDVILPDLMKWTGLDRSAILNQVLVTVHSMDVKRRSNQE